MGGCGEYTSMMAFNGASSVLFCVTGGLGSMSRLANFENGNFVMYVGVLFSSRTVQVGKMCQG